MHKIIVCEKCKNDFCIDQSEIPKSGISVKCKSCSSTISVFPVPEDNQRKDYGNFIDWLKRDGLESYVDLLEANDICDKRIISGLKEKDLIRIGITSVGHRKKILLLSSRLQDMFEFVRKINKAYLAAFLLSIAYVSGYIINSTFLRSLGINSIPFEKSTFLEAGLTFLGFSLVFILAPTCITLTFRQLLKKMPDTNLEVFLRTTVSVACIYIVSFLTLFLSDEDWNLIFPKIYNHEINTGHLVFLYISTIFLLMALSVQIHHRIKPKIAVPVSIASILVGFLLTVFMILFIDDNFPWFRHVIYSMFNYFLCLSLLYYIIRRVRKRWKEHFRIFFRVNLITIACLFSIVLLYGAVYSYTHQIYIYIPLNRGGQLPTSKSIFSLAMPRPDDFTPIISGTTKDYYVSTPLYWIVSDNKFAYVCDTFDPLTLFKSPPKIYALPKDKIIATSIFNVTSPPRHYKKGNKSSGP